MRQRERANFSPKNQHVWTSLSTMRAGVLYIHLTPRMYVWCGILLAHVSYGSEGFREGPYFAVHKAFVVDVHFHTLYSNGTPSL